jgi:hypothetical protein
VLFPVELERNLREKSAGVPRYSRLEVGRRSGGSLSSASFLVLGVDLHQLLSVPVCKD